jgi:hypothetical protein
MNTILPSSNILTIINDTLSLASLVILRLTIEFSQALISSIFIIFVELNFKKEVLPYTVY